MPSQRMVIESLLWLKQRRRVLLRSASAFSAPKHVVLKISWRRILKINWRVPHAWCARQTCPCDHCRHVSAKGSVRFPIRQSSCPNSVATDKLWAASRAPEDGVQPRAVDPGHRPVVQVHRHVTLTMTARSSGRAK
jgi:hypothetical protein